MSAIGPGDWVECVDASPHPRNTPVQAAWVTRISAGAIYCVERLGLDGGDGGATLFLVGCPCEPESAALGLGWRAARFRPIYRPKSELIETLLRKANRPVKEDA